MSNWDTRSLLMSFRGLPQRCDFCGKEKAPEELEPEESGDWVCWDCLTRWRSEEKAYDQGHS